MTALTVEVTADFQDEEEREAAEWDLCSPDTSYGHNVCRYQSSEGQGKKFTARNETQIETIKVMDGSWYLKITASNGGVTGRVYTTKRIVEQDDGESSGEIVGVENDIVRVDRCDYGTVSENVSIRSAESAAPALDQYAWMPQISFSSDPDRIWHPICAQGFKENNHGATAVCREVGFWSGQVNGTYEMLEAGFPVGKCNIGESLDACRAGAQDVTYGCVTPLVSSVFV
jgi:hypothetical protein